MKYTHTEANYCRNFVFQRLDTSTANSLKIRILNKNGYNPKKKKETLYPVYMLSKKNVAVIQ